jgi:SAM-dependent methyltransferase
MTKILKNTKKSMSEVWLGFLNAISKFSPKAMINSLYDSFLEVREKLKNIKQANLDLGSYHFENNHHSDAILRYKIIKLFYPDVKIASYFIGRCYIEIRKYKKAESYLKTYLESGDLKMRDEAKYCYDIAINRFENTKRVPASIIARIFDNLVRDYEKIYLFEDCPQSKLVTIIKNAKERKEIEKLEQILDVGCGIGNVLYNLKAAYPGIKAYGVDVSKKTLAYTRKIEHENLPVFEEVILGDYEAEGSISNLGKRKYDLILFSLSLDYTSNIETVLSQYASMLDDGGCLAISHITGSKAKLNAYFDPDYEEFYHSENKVDSILQSLDFKVIVEEGSEFIGQKIGRVLLAKKTSSSKKQAKASEINNE